MNLVRLIYVSRFSTKVGPNDVQDVLRESRKHNVELGITGVLCYDGQFFLQCLEGSRGEVSSLYNRIAADKRHIDVTLLEFKDISERLFSSWSMAYVRIEDLTKPILLKYSASTVFNPFEMSSEQTLGFIKEISDERKNYLESVKKSLSD